MIHLIKETFYIAFNNIPITTIPKVKLKTMNGLICTFIWTIPIAITEEILFPDTQQDICSALLHNFTVRPQSRLKKSYFFALLTIALRCSSNVSSETVYYCGQVMKTFTNSLRYLYHNMTKVIRQLYYLCN